MTTVNRATAPLCWAAVALEGFDLVADRIGIRRAVVIWFAAAAVFLAVLAVRLPGAGVYASVLLAGVFVFSAQVLVYAYVGERYPPHVRATALGAISGPALGGALLGAGIAYPWGFHAFATGELATRQKRAASCCGTTFSPQAARISRRVRGSCSPDGGRRRGPTRRCWVTLRGYPIGGGALMAITDPPRPSPEIGTRARTIRKRRGLGLGSAADFAGISKAYLSQLETGKRQFDRLGLIENLAGALGCSVADLTGQPYLPPDRDTADANACLPEIAVIMHDVTLDDVPDLPARPVSALTAAVESANRALDDAHFGLAGRGLAQVILELHVTIVSGSSDDQRAALAALADACMVATSIARHLGHHELAVQVARRGYEASARIEDPARTGLLSMHSALGLAWMGAERRIGGLLGDALTRIAPSVDPSAEDSSSAQAAGMLYLTAALHHARNDRAGDADSHLAEAHSLAQATGETNGLYQHFGPAHVALWGVEMAVELGRGPSVAQRTESDVPALLDALGSKNRRCVLTFDMARAYGQDGGSLDQHAIRHLDMADQFTRQVRNVPVARELLRDLNHRARRRVWELESLSTRFGIVG